MFIGFIAVIIVLLVIIVVMSVNGGQNGSNADYFAEAAKVKATIHHMTTESQFYYVGNNQSYEGIDADYFKEVGFEETEFGTDTMSSDDWLGLPDGHPCDGNPCPYMRVGGPADDNMRILVESTSDGQGLIVRIIGLDQDGDGEVDNVDPLYPPILEQTMRGDSNFLGG